MGIIGIIPWKIQKSKIESLMMILTNKKSLKNLKNFDFGNWTKCFKKSASDQA